MVTQSLFAQKSRALCAEIVQNGEGGKKSQKIKKTFKKVLTKAFDGGIICKLSARAALGGARKQREDLEN